MNKLLLFLTFCLTTISLNAQLNTERVICTTGGTFLAENNMVKVYAYQPSEDETNEIAAFPGDFGNDVIVDGRYAYAHVGRGFNNPAGQDEIYKIDLITGEVTDSLEAIPGVTRLAIYQDWLVVGKGFGGIGANLQFFNKNDLSQAALADGTDVISSVGGHTFIEEKLYVSFTQADTGRVAVYDMSGDLPAFEETIVLDTLSKSIGDLISDGESLYALNSHVEFDADFNVLYSFAGVTKIDLSDNSFVTAPQNFADGALVIAENSIDGSSVIIGNFGSGGNFVNTETLMPLGLSFLPFYTDGIADATNQYLWVQVTDYNSFGEVTAYDSMGEEVVTFETDISGSAVDLAYNLSPIVEDDMLQGAFVTTEYDLLENDIDPEGEALTIIDVFNVVGGTVTVSAEGDKVEATFDDSATEITFSYAVVDVWGRSAAADVTIANFTSTEDFEAPVAIQAFPNPAQSEVFVSLEAFDNQDVMVVLRSVDGKEILRNKVENATACTLDLSTVNTGLYLIEAISEGKKAQVKVSKL